MAANSRSIKANTGGNDDAPVLCPTETTTVGARCIRLRGAAVKSGRVVPSSVPAPVLEEELSGVRKHRQSDCVQAVVNRIILKALIVALVSLVASFIGVLLDWPSNLVVALLATGVTTEIVCWVLFLCSLAEQSRSMLATILLPREKKKQPEAEKKIRKERDVVHEALSVGGAGNYSVAV